MNAGGNNANNTINSQEKKRKKHLENFSVLNRSKTTFSADINIDTWLKVTTSDDPDLIKRLLKYG